MEAMRFAGKVALVTGAGSGIGLAAARLAAAEGGAVACLDVVGDAADEAAAGIRDAGGTARGYQVDVAKPESVRAAVKAAADQLGRPSVLLNCAGIGKFANAHDMPFEDWSRILAVNLTGTFLMCQAALPYLLDGGGNIVNIGSTAGLIGQPYSAAYCASKGGVVQLTRALAEEYLRRGVRVNCVCPGGVDTPLVKNFYQLPEGADASLLSKIMTPLGVSQPEEIAALVLFIASDQGRYMTGSIVTMDGGLTM